MPGQAQIKLSFLHGALGVEVSGKATDSLLVLQISSIALVKASLLTPTTLTWLHSRLRLSGVEESSSLNLMTHALWTANLSRRPRTAQLIIKNGPLGQCDPHFLR